MSYETVFDTTTIGFHGWWFPAIGLAFVVISAWSLFTPAAKQPLPRIIRPAHRRALNVFGLIFATLWTFAAGAMTISNHLALRNASASNNCQIAEGQVADFLPAEHGGRKQESFTVSGVHFAYSEYVISSGFNHTQSRGGPIHDGLHVRICYVPSAANTIVRLETARVA